MDSALTLTCVSSCDQLAIMEYMHQTALYMIDLVNPLNDNLVHWDISIIIVVIVIAVVVVILQSFFLHP